jgi:acyl-CoA synthetase (AMP-forming)/AMP-acid ligase II
VSEPIRSCHADLKRLFQTQPKAPALIDAHNGASLSYADLDQLTARAAAFLEEHGASPERPVVAVLPNALDTLVLFLGALRAGIDFAPLTPQTSPRDLSGWLDLVKPALCVYSLSSSDVVEASVSDVSRISIVPSGSFRWLESTPQADLPGSERASRLLLHTSGTTGEPKVLVFDCDRLWSSGRAFAQHHDFLSSNCRFFNILPMSYLGGLYNLCLLPLSLGASVAVGDTFSGKSFISFWADLERLEVNVLWLVPTIIRGLLTLAKRTKSRGTDLVRNEIRACFAGTASIDLTTKQEFEEEFGIPVLENYALSETTFITSETLGSRYRRKECSVGEVLPYVAVRTASTPGDKDGEKVREIEVRTPYLFLGYLRSDGNVELPETPDGYFRTGDLGNLVGEGTLLYHGRTRDIIKKGGYLIVLREVEVLAEQHPLVEEAVAVPVEHDFYGEDYVLALRLHADADPEEALSEIRIWVNANMAQYKWPGKIVARDEIPRTDSGKVRKRLLSEELSKR